MNEIVPTSVPSDFLMRIASDGAIDAEKLRIMAEIYINMQEKQRAWAEADDNRRAHKEYLDAKAKMQAELPIIGRDAINEQTRSKYARFESIWEECCPIWSRHGFSVSFDVATLENQMIRVKMLLEHRGGHIEEFLAPDTPSDTMGPRGNATKTPVQGNQSTVTYVQRGLLCRGVGIAMKGFDEDGNAGHRERPVEAAPPSQEPETLEDMPASNREWLNKVQRRLEAASTSAEIERIKNIPSVKEARKSAPIIIRGIIEDSIRDADARLAAVVEAASDQENEAAEAQHWAETQEKQQ